MEITKILLPLITLENYELLKKALKYYQISNIEFTIDGETTTMVTELIDYIERCKKIKQIKVFSEGV